MQNMKMQNMKMQNMKTQNMKMQNMKMHNMKIQNMKMFFVVSRLGHRSIQSHNILIYLVYYIIHIMMTACAAAYRATCDSMSKY